MIVVEKNYRLQDIQLSKSPRLRDLRSLRRGRLTLLCARQTSSTKRLIACLAEARSAKFRERRLVENTGLEPVTSWLQTRRSPS